MQSYDIQESQYNVTLSYTYIWIISTPLIFFVNGYLPPICLFNKH